MAATLNLGDRAPSSTTSPRDGRPRGSPLILAVEAMHCGNCLRRVEATVLGVDGVVAARANLSTGRVMVVSDGTAPSPDRLVEALATAGYRARALSATIGRSSAGLEQDLLRRLAVAGFAATNIMLLSIAVWAGHGGDMAPSLASLLHWLSALIAVPAVSYAGMPFYTSARAALSQRRINMDVPISLGVILTTLMSLYQSHLGSDQVYFDAATTLLTFLLLGRWLDQRMRTRATGAAENLLSQQSPWATVIGPDGHAEQIVTTDVTPGLRMLVASGERVPVDGEIVHGQPLLDESAMTGESMPRQAHIGDCVYAGTVNLGEAFEAKATSGLADTRLAEIARLMTVAEQAKGRYVRLADRAAALYAPLVHILSLVTFIGGLMVGRDWQDALTAAIAVLIITCPCALALAVPAVQVAAVSRLFSRGVIVRAPDALERLAQVDTVVLDKTGTLTLGEPSLVATPQPIAQATLMLAASLAAASRHPYARAIVAAARHRGLAVIPAASVSEVPGAGLWALVDGTLIKLGSAAFCSVHKPLGQRAASLWLRHGDEPAIGLELADPLRDDARETVSRLIQGGFKVELLSGDQSAIVERTAALLGIQTWRGQVSPEAKAARIGELKAAGHRVLMVGDGINDAPALATARASMAPSSGTDISQIAADMIFQGSRLSPVLEAIEVAKAAHRAALQNFAMAIGYNVIFVPLAMLGLVTPLIAAIAMSGSSIVVTANALRLRARPIGRQS